MAIDDVGDGCLGFAFRIVIEAIILGTGYGILRLFGRGRGGFTGVDEVLGYILGGLTWAGLGFAAYLLL